MVRSSPSTLPHEKKCYTGTPYRKTWTIGVPESIWFLERGYFKRVASLSNPPCLAVWISFFRATTRKPGGPTCHGSAKRVVLTRVAKNALERRRCLQVRLNPGITWTHLSISKQCVVACCVLVGPAPRAAAPREGRRRQNPIPHYNTFGFANLPFWGVPLSL